MLVPETAVNEDHLSTTAEHQVWFAGELGSMEPKTIAEREQQPAHK
jgi:hypothetical protein